MNFITRGIGKESVTTVQERGHRARHSEKRGAPRGCSGCSGTDLDPHLRVGPLERLLAQVPEVLVLLVLVRHLRDVGVVDLQPVLPTRRDAYEIDTR
jgi:hypothetical protein